MTDARSPSSISGLVGWYTGFSAEVTSGSVSSWKDISGQGNHATTIRGSPKVDSVGVSTRGVPDATRGPTQFPFLRGGTEDGLRFPTAVMNVDSPNYTLFHVAKYLTNVFDDQNPNTPFTGTLSGNANGPATRITSSTGGGYIELTGSLGGTIGSVYWQLTLGDSWEVDAEIYIQPVNYGGADDIRFVFYGSNPITSSFTSTGTNGYGGHAIIWEYYEGDTVVLRDAADANLASAGVNLNMNEWMPINVKYDNGQFTATIKNSGGGVLNTTTYNFGSTFSSIHDQPRYFGFVASSGGVTAIDRVRNIRITSGEVSGVRGRIFDGLGNNWLSGFHANAVGGAYHGGTNWITPQSDLHGNGWVLSTDQRNMYRSNGTNRTTATYTDSKSTTLTINYGTQVANETSDWAVAEVIVFNRELTSAEYLSVEAYLSAKYFISGAVPATGVISGSLLNAIFYTGTDGVGGSAGYPISISRLGRRIGTTLGTILRASNFRERGLGSLDSITLIPSAAYSLRRLFYSYGGAQVRVRRSTDNVQADIFMDKHGVIVTIENSTEKNLTTWLGGGTAYVTTWYDQSGNGRHTSGYVSGSASLPYLVYVDGRYVIYFPGTSTTSGGYFNAGSFTFNIASNGGVSTFSRVNFLNAETWERVYDYGNGTANNNLLFARINTSGNTRFEMFEGGIPQTLDSTSVITNNKWHSFGNRISGSGTSWTFTTRRNGSQVASSVKSVSITNRTISGSYIGRSHWSGDRYSNMYLTDQIFFDKAITDAEFAIMESAL